jgi:hypothetical protein
MRVRLRTALVALLPIVILLTIVATSASSSRARLTGSWSGYMNRTAGSEVKRHRLWLVVNASERGGSWKISARCHGPLKLKDISNGYHHYVEKLAPGANCLGGGIDCLKRVGAGLYDTFQSHPGTSYNSDGTLHRVAA